MANFILLFFSVNPFSSILKSRDRRKSLDNVSVDNNPTLGEKWNILIMWGPYDLCLLWLYGNNKKMQKQVQGLYHTKCHGRETLLYDINTRPEKNI